MCVIIDKVIFSERWDRGIISFLCLYVGEYFFGNFVKVVLSESVTGMSNIIFSIYFQ